MKQYVILPTTKYVATLYLEKLWH